MTIQIQRCENAEVEPLRDLYRQEAGVQIVCDSALRRGIADAYLITVDGHIAGYGGVWNRYSPGRLMEFHTLPQVRAAAQPMYRELLTASRAKQAEAQTNMPLMLTMLYDHACNIVTEKVLFHDAFTSRLPSPGGTFRRAKPEDGKDGQWLIEDGGAVVATGGFLTHYNPPYGDVYMEVAPDSRRKGFGSYLVQEVKRVCYEAGRKPAARCDPGNVASRRTLEKAGLLPCGRLLVGDIAPASP